MISLVSNRGRLNILDDSNLLAKEVAERFLTLALGYMSEKAQFTVALAGGITPRLLYQKLSEDKYAEKVPWAKTFLFFGDERCVAHTDPESNYLLVKNTLASKVAIPTVNVNRLEGQDTDPKEAAHEYENTIKTFFELQPGEFPSFDLMLLGLGPDGHTASLFPGTKALNETEHICVANYVEKFGHHRITLTYPVINKAKNVFFLVTGASKADIVKDVLQGEEGVYPAQFVNPINAHDEGGNLEWFLDKAAASKLDLAVPMV